MKSILEYLTERNLLESSILETKADSDDSIYYRLAKNMWMWIKHQRANAIEGIKKKYHISESNPRRGLIRWFKDCYPPIPDASKEVIPRSQWDIDGIVGQTENQIMHKHYDDIAKYHFAHPDKRHDILVVFECSNKKPYNDDSSKIIYMRMFDNYCDFANADYGLIPYAFCEYYPYRYDEWDHYSEGEYGSWWYREVSKINFTLFMKHWGYKKAIVCMQNPHPRQFIVEMKKDNFAGMGDKIDIVVDDEFDDMIKRKYSSVFGSNGLVVTRKIGLKETRLAICKAVEKAMKELNYPKEDIKRISEMRSLIDKHRGEGLGKELKAEGFTNKPSYAEWPYGEKDEDGKSKNECIREPYEHIDMINESTQADFKKGLTKLRKELDELDVEKIKEEKIEKDMGDDIDLVKNPDDLYSIYEWAWPCGKLLYWLNGKKLHENLQEEYDSLKTLMHKQDDFGCINEYFFYYKPITDKLGWKEKDVWENALKIHFIEDHRDILNFEL